ncbi:hypothetical protein B0A49_13321, partial [Cryomyces minteri]
MTGRRPLLSEQSQGSGYPPSSSLEKPTRQTTTPAVQEGLTHESWLPSVSIRQPDLQPSPPSANNVDESDLIFLTYPNPNFDLQSTEDYSSLDNSWSTQNSFNPSNATYSSTQLTQVSESSVSPGDLLQERRATVGPGRRDIDGQNIISSAPAISAPLVPEVSRRERSQMDQPSECDHDSSSQPSPKQPKLSAPEERVAEEDAELLTTWLEKNKREPSIEEKHELADLAKLRPET